MCYSMDMVAKLAFEKEIEHLNLKGCDLCNLSDEKDILIEYFEKRVEEINETYKDF